MNGAVGALADIGIYGAVSVRDLAEAHFGGHPYTTRRAVNAWTRDGLAQETRATRTQRQHVQGADPHAERRGRGPEAGRRAGNRSRPGDRVRTLPGPPKPRTTPPSIEPAARSTNA